MKKIPADTRRLQHSGLVIQLLSFGTQAQYFVVLYRELFFAELRSSGSSTCELCIRIFKVS
jgi:hypothetical protein